jgi:uncharacterized protein
LPSFSNPFTNVSPDMKLSKEDIISTLRFAVSAELEAISIYKQIAAKTDILVIRDNMNSIANEEMIHVGELLRLISYLDEEEFNKYQEGMKESSSIIRKSLGVKTEKNKE